MAKTWYVQISGMMPVVADTAEQAIEEAKKYAGLYSWFSARTGDDTFDMAWDRALAGHAAATQVEIKEEEKPWKPGDPLFNCACWGSMFCRVCKPGLFKG